MTTISCPSLIRDTKKTEQACMSLEIKTGGKIVTQKTIHQSCKNVRNQEENERSLKAVGHSPGIKTYELDTSNLNFWCICRLQVNSHVSEQLEMKFFRMGNLI